MANAGLIQNVPERIRAIEVRLGSCWGQGLWVGQGALSSITGQREQADPGVGVSDISGFHGEGQNGHRISPCGVMWSAVQGGLGFRLKPHCD